MIKQGKVAALSVTLDELNFPITIHNALKRGGFNTLQDIIDCGYVRILRYRCIGTTNAETIRSKLCEYGFDWVDYYKTPRKRHLIIVTDEEMRCSSCGFVLDDLIYREAAKRISYCPICGRSYDVHFDWGEAHPAR